MLNEEESVAVAAEGRFVSFDYLVVELVVCFHLKQPEDGVCL